MKIAYRLAWLLFVLLCVIAGVFYYNPVWVAEEQTRYDLLRHGVRSKYIQVDSHRIHYFEASPPDRSAGIPLVLVHGLGDRGEAWAAQIPALAAAGFHVYVPDLLGYGRSDKPDITYSIPVEVSTVYGFLNAVGLQHADVAGWSMGGWIAAKFTLEHPTVVDRLILEDSAGIRFDANFPRDLFTPHDEAGLNRLTEWLSPVPAHVPHFVARSAIRRLQNQARIVQSSLDSMESGQDLLDNRLGAIKQPTLIIWGSEDRLLPLSTGEEMHREISDSVLARINGCGHLAPRECARPVLEATIQFLTANPPMLRGDETLPGTTDEPTPAKVPQPPH